MTSILGLVPARGGSKGVPRKNARDLAGKPLLAWTAAAAREAGGIDRLVLSTDDDEIAATGRRLGLEVPFRRPQVLATDQAPMFDVVLHALDELEKREGWVPDAVALLQPTSPLRTAAHIRASLSLLEEADAVCSVTPLPKELCPHFVMRIDPAGYLDFFMPDGDQYTRRQDVPQAYRRDGTIYLTRTAVIREERSLYGDRCLPLLIPSRESLSIDDESDWEEAERRLAERARSRPSPLLTARGQGPADDATPRRQG